MTKRVKAVQLMAAPWDGINGRTYSVFILGSDGVVYRYDAQCEGWIPWPMKVVGCRGQHKGKR